MVPHRWGIFHYPHAKMLDNGLRLWLLSSITKWWLGRDGDAFWVREKEREILQAIGMKNEDGGNDMVFISYQTF